MVGYNQDYTIRDTMDLACCPLSETLMKYSNISPLIISETLLKKRRQKNAIEIFLEKNSNPRVMAFTVQVVSDTLIQCKSERHSSGVRHHLHDKVASFGRGPSCSSTERAGRFAGFIKIIHATLAHWLQSHGPFATDVDYNGFMGRCVDLAARSTALINM